VLTLVVGFATYGPTMTTQIQLPPIVLTDKNQLRELELSLLHYLDVVRLAMQGASCPLQEGAPSRPIAEITPRPDHKRPRQECRDMITQIVSRQTGEFNSRDIYTIVRQTKTYPVEMMSGALLGLVKTKVLRLVKKLAPSQGMILEKR
jgi:hypothetical protein